MKKEMRLLIRLHRLQTHPRAKPSHKMTKKIVSKNRAMTMTIILVNIDISRNLKEVKPKTQD